MMLSGGALRSTRSIWRVASSVVVLLLATASACSLSGADDENSTIRIGVLPDQDADRLLTQYEPLLEYLEETTGAMTELYLPESYDDLVGRFEARALDIGWFGGLTFLLAQEFGAMPLVMRDIDLEFTSDIVVSASAPGTSLYDFAGADFAFGPELSTSGHLMPQYFLSDSIGPPNEFFGSIAHSAGHDQTVRWVRDGMVDIGAANSSVVEQMLSEGVVTSDDVRVLTRTTPYRNYVWASSPTLDEGTRTRLLEAFLALDPTDPEHRVILDLVGADGFIPARADDFETLRIAAEEAGLLHTDDTTS